MVNKNLSSIPCPRRFLPKQKRVLDAISKYKYVLYSGAFGAGKTLLVCHIVIRECLKHPHSLWFFGSQTVPMLRDTILRTFLEEVDLYQLALNDAGVDVVLEKQFRSNTMSYKFFNDSEVLFRSCDDPMKFKSLNLDGFALDEPVDIDEEVFKMLQGRLRANHTKHHIGVMAGNPSGKTNWVYKRFFEESTPEYFAVHTSTYDNIFLPKDYIPSLEASYDIEYQKRYLRGEWGSFEGQIYKDFSYDKHVGSFRDVVCKYYLAGYDDGYRNPSCLLTIGVDDDNHVFVKDEIYESGMTNSDMLALILERNSKYGFNRIMSDPNAVNIIEMMRNNHLRVEAANNDVDFGISKLRSFFKNDLLFIDKGCKNLIKELESYRYDKNTERPIKKDDHALDALRYGLSGFNPFHKNVDCVAGNFSKFRGV